MRRPVCIVPMALVSSLIGVVLLAGPTLAAEQAPLPQEIDWATLRELVRERSADLDYRRSLVAVAAAQRHGVKAYANPTFDVGVLVHVAGSNTFDTAQPSIGISQPIRLVGKESARRAAVDSLIRLAEADAAQFERELLHEARRLYTALQVAQARAAATATLLGEVADMVAIVEQRVRGGVASQYDANKIAREVAQVRMMTEEAELEIEHAGRELAVLLGVRAWSPRAKEPLVVGSADRATGGGTAAEQAGEAKLDSHAELLRAEAALAAARSRAHQVERERWPDLVVSGGVAMTTDELGVAPYVGLSIDLMVFDKQRQEVEVGRAEAVAAERERESTRRRLEARADAARALLERRRAALTRWDTALGQNLGTLSAQAREAYLAGRIELIDLLDSLRSEGETRLSRIDLAALVAESEVELRFALGLGD